MTPFEQERIETSRVALVPLAPAQRRSVLDGDLTGLVHADGWPHADTLDALRPDWPVWLVVADGLVVGECGTVGGVMTDGEVEIGLGLAAERRGRGLGTEVIAALAAWLARSPAVRRIVARVDVGNVASRRAFEKAGFVLERSDERACLYVREPRQTT